MDPGQEFGSLLGISPPHPGPVLIPFLRESLVRGPAVRDDHRSGGYSIPDEPHQTLGRGIRSSAQTNPWSCPGFVEGELLSCAFSYEMTGASRSNPSGGFADKNTFRCVGENHSFGGKTGGTAVCEAVDPEGDKRLTYFFFQGEKVVRETVAGTGKYDGMVMTGSTVQSLGPFPVIKPGTFQSCNRQTGTYKLK